MGPETEDPTTLLDDVEALRSRTNAALNADGWRWTLVWSLVSLGAGLTVAVDWLNELASFYWFAAVPLAFIATAVLEQRSKSQRAVRRDGGRYWAIGAAMAVANFGASMVMPTNALVIFIWIVVGLGFAGFAALDGDNAAVVLFLSAAVLALVVGMVVEDAAVAYAAISVLFAGLLAGSAAQIYSRYRTL